MQNLKEQKTHDYTKRGWGHDLSWDVLDGQKLKIIGWGGGVSAGDFLILPNAGSSTRYKVDEISYYSDPRDQFKAIASFSPRPDNEKEI